MIAEKQPAPEAAAFPARKDLAGPLAQTSRLRCPASQIPLRPRSIAARFLNVKDELPIPHGAGKPPTVGQTPYPSRPIRPASLSWQSLVPQLAPAYRLQQLLVQGSFLNLSEEKRFFAF